MSLEVTELLVDRAAATSLSLEQVQAWATGRRVFISSAVEGLEIERRSVAEATAGLGATAVLFEDFGARDDDAQQAYLAEVASCDVYVGILGTRYGRLLATRRSATHEEYREAESRGLRICVWTRSDCVWDGDQQVFVDEVRTFHVTNGFADATDLAGRVGRRLAQLAAEDLSPWCKLGRVILRADRISSTSAHVEIAARVKDHDVLAALQAMHPPPGLSTDIGISRSADTRLPGPRTAEFLVGGHLISWWAVS